MVANCLQASHIYNKQQPFGNLQGYWGNRGFRCGIFRELAFSQAVQPAYLFAVRLYANCHRIAKGQW